MGKSLQQAVADAYTRQKDDRQRELTEREKQCKRLEPVAVRLSMVLAHPELKDIGTFGVEKDGLGFRFALPSCTTDSVLVEAFEDRILLKRGRESVTIPIRELNNDSLVEAVAYMMAECFITSAHIQGFLDRGKIQEVRHASL